eukprot:GHVL01024992.1.p1 GENE.GHVL01024992.1~~GHVL01024992.1.p1  ORF type:complete len:100 (+),score=19.16 GHVL01024992.1:50-349(+)
MEPVTSKMTEEEQDVSQYVIVGRVDYGEEDLEPKEEISFWESATELFLSIFICCGRRKKTSQFDNWFRYADLDKYPSTSDNSTDEGSLQESALDSDAEN